MKKSSKHISTQTKVAIGVGTLALAAATYYFFGPGGKKHRATLKGWMIRMKGEVIERMEKAKEMTEGLYHNIIDAVAARYTKSGVPEADIKAFVADLKKGWKGFAASSVTKRGAGRSAKAPSKKTSVRKSASKKAASQQ